MRIPAAFLRSRGRWLRCKLTGAAATAYLQLHTGDPGAAGTSNQATTTTRKSATFANNRNTSAVRWTGVNDGETVAWLSAWDAATNGNLLGKGKLASPVAERGTPITFNKGTITY